MQIPCEHIHYEAKLKPNSNNGRLHCERCWYSSTFFHFKLNPNTNVHTQTHKRMDGVVSFISWMKNLRWPFLLAFWLISVSRSYLLLCAPQSFAYARMYLADWFWSVDKILQLWRIAFEPRFEELFSLHRFSMHLEWLIAPLKWPFHWIMTFIYARANEVETRHMNRNVILNWINKMLLAANQRRFFFFHFAS